MGNRRMTRKFKDLNEQNLNELIRETYSDIVDEKSKALTLYNKYFGEIYKETDGEDPESDAINRRNTIALVGKHLTDSLKLIDSSIDNKVKLIKIYSNHLLKTGNTDTAEELNRVANGISSNDKSDIHELIKSMKLDSDISNLGNLGDKEYD